MWSHDEGMEIPDITASRAIIKCPECGRFVKKYVPSWYTGGMKCVLLAKYCKYCHGELRQ